MPVIILVHCISRIVISGSRLLSRHHAWSAQLYLPLLKFSLFDKKSACKVVMYFVLSSSLCLLTTIARRQCVAYTRCVYDFTSNVGERVHLLQPPRLPVSNLLTIQYTPLAIPLISSMVVLRVNPELLKHFEHRDVPNLEEEFSQRRNVYSTT